MFSNLVILRAYSSIRKSSLSSFEFRVDLGFTFCDEGTVSDDKFAKLDNAFLHRFVALTELVPPA